MGASTVTSSPTRTVARFVNPEDLICPGCGDQVIGVPPAYWPARDGLPMSGFSHPDRTALCRTSAGRVVEPVEVTPVTALLDQDEDGTNERVGE